VHYLIGPMIAAKPSRAKNVFRWAKSPDRWHRRAACVALIQGKTLAQAVKLHSLQASRGSPNLRYGGESFFIDVANRISYMTDSKAPSVSPEGIGKNVVNIL